MICQSLHYFFIYILHSTNLVRNRVVKLLIVMLSQKQVPVLKYLYQQVSSWPLIEISVRKGHKLTYKSTHKCLNQHSMLQYCQRILINLKAAFSEITVNKLLCEQYCAITKLYSVPTCLSTKLHSLLTHVAYFTLMQTLVLELTIALFFTEISNKASCFTGSSNKATNVLIITSKCQSH